MRHFGFLTEADLQRLFFRPPQQFSPAGPPDELAVALGATLYIPASRADLVHDIAKGCRHGVVSAVLCLEDAISDTDLAAAEGHVITQLRRYAQSATQGLLLFLRVRSAEQIPMIMAGLGEHAGALSGFVLPKFTEESGPAFLDAVVGAGEAIGRRLLVMPVLESPEVMFAESRIDALFAVRRLLEKYRQYVLAVRVGATDLSALFGLRRSRELTVYDVRVVADAISDIVNVFGRTGSGGYVVTGPVWEYFASAERLFKPQLRESPFVAHTGPELRTQLIDADLDGLIREVVLDKANGLTGKTVIHPSHVNAVHALSVITHEEYLDASDILRTRACGGIVSSSYRNKMNESKPHAAWATKIMQRAALFGVAREEVSFVDLLGAGSGR
ncbi:MAG: HpcH/HpaI aldolase/citrate lyase family protein [Sciscionella sp.]